MESNGGSQKSSNGKKSRSKSSKDKDSASYTLIPSSGDDRPLPPTGHPAHYHNPAAVAGEMPAISPAMEMLDKVYYLQDCLKTVNSIVKNFYKNNGVSSKSSSDHRRGSSSGSDQDGDQPTSEKSRLTGTLREMRHYLEALRIYFETETYAEPMPHQHHYPVHHYGPAGAIEYHDVPTSSATAVLHHQHHPGADLIDRIASNRIEEVDEEEEKAAEEEHLKKAADQPRRKSSDKGLMSDVLERERDMEYIEESGSSPTTQRNVRNGSTTADIATLAEIPEPGEIPPGGDPHGSRVYDLREGSASYLALPANIDRTSDAGTSGTGRRKSSMDEIERIEKDSGRGESIMPDESVRGGPGSVGGGSEAAAAPSQKRGVHTASKTISYSPSDGGTETILEDDEEVHHEEHEDQASSSAVSPTQTGSGTGSGAIDGKVSTQSGDDRRRKTEIITRITRSSYPPEEGRKGLMRRAKTVLEQELNSIAGPGGDGSCKIVSNIVFDSVIPTSLPPPFGMVGSGAVTPSYSGYSRPPSRGVIIKEVNEDGTSKYDGSTEELDRSVPPSPGGIHPHATHPGGPATASSTLERDTTRSELFTNSEPDLSSKAGSTLKKGILIKDHHHSHQPRHSETDSQEDLLSDGKHHPESVASPPLIGSPLPPGHPSDSGMGSLHTETHFQRKKTTGGGGPGGTLVKGPDGQVLGGGPAGGADASSWEYTMECNFSGAGATNTTIKTTLKHTYSPMTIYESSV